MNYLSRFSLFPFYVVLLVRGGYRFHLWLISLVILVTLDDGDIDSI